MAAFNNYGPEHILSDDPGDDMQRWIRYQNTYAAILLLDLVSSSPSSKYVFCEHHDVILVQRDDGSFIAIQVKTKQQGHSPWKTDDPQMASVIDRFVEMEYQFADRFFR